MERAPVDSTCLRSVGHDAGRRVLEVEFVGGTVYHYFGVPSAVVARLLAAPSLGRYFNHEIRYRYRFVRIIPAPPSQPWPPSSPPV
jgi:hypothetical protein